MKKPALLIAIGIRREGILTHKTREPKIFSIDQIFFSIDVINYKR
jgi:hypothetical protein